MLEIVVFAVVCGYVIYQRFLHPLSRYPGPLLASLSNVWKAYHVYQGDLEYAILKLHQEHGKIVRIGPNHLDISDAAAVKDIYLTGKSFVKRYTSTSIHIAIPAADPSKAPSTTPSQPSVPTSSGRETRTSTRPGRRPSPRASPSSP